jgi:broad specificity phosphatase PhoE
MIQHGTSRDVRPAGASGMATWGRRRTVAIALPLNRGLRALERKLHSASVIERGKTLQRGFAKGSLTDTILFWRFDLSSKLFFLRHGETLQSERRALWRPEPLCALGLEMQLRDGVKGIRYGKWEYKSVDFVKEHYWDHYIRWLAEPAWNPPTGGETFVEISSRASLDRIILCSLLGIDLGRYRDRIDMLAGSISIVTFDVHGPLQKIVPGRNAQLAIAILKCRHESTRFADNDQQSQFGAQPRLASARSSQSR